MCTMYLKQWLFVGINPKHLKFHLKKVQSVPSAYLWISRLLLQSVWYNVGASSIFETFQKLSPVKLLIKGETSYMSTFYRIFPIFKLCNHF